MRSSAKKLVNAMQVNTLQEALGYAMLVKCDKKEDRDLVECLGKEARCFISPSQIKADRFVGFAENGFFVIGKGNRQVNCNMMYVTL